MTNRTWTPLSTRFPEPADMEMLLRHRNDPSTRMWLGNGDPVTAQQNEEFWHSAAAKHYCIVSEGSRDIGLIRLVPDPDPFEKGRVCVGADLFIHARGQGLGHAIFDLACQRAKERLSARHLWLKVFLQNTPAVRVYLRAGFVFARNTVVESVVRNLPYGPQSAGFHYATMERDS